mgnify:CR=1 FL=1
MRTITLHIDERVLSKLKTYLMITMMKSEVSITDVVAGKICDAIKESKMELTLTTKKEVEHGNK